MDAAVNRDIGARPLQLLGISDTGERAYRVLLERHKATAAVIADQLRITCRVARKLLADLESMGLATHTPKIPASSSPERLHYSNIAGGRAVSMVVSPVRASKPWLPGRPRERRVRPASRAPALRGP